MKRGQFLVSILCLVGMIVAVGCRGAGGGAQRLAVATSTNVLGDLVRQVVGDRADVITVVPSGQSPANYGANPQDVIALGRAKVIFANGLAYEGPVDELFVQSKVRVVTLSDGLVRRQTEINHGDHEHRFANAYMYLNALNAKKYVERIRDTMMELDPSYADQYRANAERYLAELTALDQWVESEIKRIPEPNRPGSQSHSGGCSATRAWSGAT